MTIKLAHVCLETTDLEATERFYALLGIERRFEFRNGQGELVGYYLAFDNETFIEVIKVKELKEGGVLRHFAMETDDIQQSADRLRSGGVAVTDREWAGDNNWMITCHDPNGVFIEIQQYTDTSMQRNGGVCEVDYQP